MDKEVDRLCAVDGGIKVYDKIPLPLERFNQWGDPLIPIAGIPGSAKEPYLLEIQSRVLVKGDPYGIGMPTLSRFHARVIRQSDGKSLGEVTSYLRTGGDPGGPWNPSSYNGCSEGGDKALKQRVFFKGG